MKGSAPHTAQGRADVRVFVCFKNEVNAIFVHQFFQPGTDERAIAGTVVAVLMRNKIRVRRFAL